MRIRSLSLVLTAAAAPLVAQDPTPRSERFMRNCEDREWDRRSETFCVVRDYTIRPPQRSLLVDGHDNGGVHFYGWDKNEVLVRALVQTWADSREEAESLSRQITVETGGDRIRADGPSSRRYARWSVSYEVWVPRKTSLEAETHNGGISVEDVEGRMILHAVNGGIALRQVGGDVRAETTNGGVSAILSGSTWSGQGLDLSTTNGGVVVEIPRGYNAQLETGTVNGGMNIDFPITLQGSIGRRIRTTLGSGGPRVRVTTTNGGVRIRQR